MPDLKTQAEKEVKQLLDQAETSKPTKPRGQDKLGNMSYDEIERAVLPEISAAEDYLDTRTERRGQAWERYYGEVLGNEVEGRSRFVTREVLDTIEWMMPYFIRTFASGDPKVRLQIEGQPALIGDALLKQIQTDLNNEGGSLFLLFYQWIKDCLVSDTSFVKIAWEQDYQRVRTTFDQLSPENMQQLIDDPDTDIIDAEETTLPDGQQIFRNVQVSVKKRMRDDLAAYNCPHWEFMCDPRSKDINDEYGKGHRTEVTLDFLRRINRAKRTEDGEDFFKNLDELDKDTGELSTSDITDISTQASQYLGYDLSRSDQIAERKGPKATVTYIEWYTRLDINNDGLLEDVVCYFANNRLIRAELNQDGIIPFSALRPIIDCYKFYGISYADLVIEIQNLKTMLFRRILDNFDYQNSGRWIVDPTAQVDTYELLRNRPGSVIFGKPDGVMDLTPRPFQPGTLTILEYVDTIKENRTGITRYNQGLDSASLNKRIDINTPVPMADGTWKQLKDIVDGDLIVGGDGNPTRVLKAHPIVMSDGAYRLKFNNGAEIVADAEHLWGVHIHGTYRVVNTETIAKMLDDGKSIYIPRARRIKTGSEKQLPLDPYVLGIWLGDGHKYSARITTPDDEVINRVREYCITNGWSIQKDKTQNSGKATTYIITSCNDRERDDSGKFKPEDSFHRRLSDLGIYPRTGGIPHIPDVYFTASYEQRLELLRGLMDADGCWSTSGTAIFCSSNKALIEDVASLIRSLGGSPNIRLVKRAGKEICNGSLCNVKEHWHITFNLHDCPFFITRKASQWHPPKRLNTYRIISATKTADRLMRCLTVDNPKGLWLVGEHYITTHNTATGIVQIQTAAMQRMELIARIFAETGIRDFFAKCAKLYQQYMTKPFTVSVAGQQVTVTPEMIQGKIITKVNMGVQASVGLQETQKLERLFAFLVTLNQHAPGLLQPQQVYNLARHYTTMLGFQDYDEFLPQQQQYLQALQQIQQQQAKQQELMERQLALQEASVAAKAQQGQQKIEVKALDTAAKHRLEQERLQHEKEKDEIESKLKVVDLLTRQLGGASG